MYAICICTHYFKYRIKSLEAKKAQELIRLCCMCSMIDCISIIA